MKIYIDNNAFTITVTISFTMKKIKFIINEWIWGIMGLLSLICIIILDFTQWRPFGESLKYNEINQMIRTIAYSLLASSLFYLFNEFLPSKYRRNVAKMHISRELHYIREEFMWLVRIEPFNFDKINYTKEEFVRIFAKLDLYAKYQFDPMKSKADNINSRKIAILTKCENLLASYGHELKFSQINYIESVLKSDFINQTLIPIDFAIPEEYRVKSDIFNNQELIASSIFDLYSISRKVK